MRNNNRMDAIEKMNGSVIDPNTGRLCALAVDLAQSLGWSQSTVSTYAGRIYQGRFYDIYDVIENKKTARRRGRPSRA